MNQKERFDEIVDQNLRSKDEFPDSEDESEDWRFVYF